MAHLQKTMEKVNCFSPHPSFCVQPITFQKLISMENMPVNDGNDKSFGYILYETTITLPGILRGLVRDRGQVSMGSGSTVHLTGSAILSVQDTLMVDVWHVLAIPCWAQGAHACCVLTHPVLTRAACSVLSGRSSWTQYP